jgi:predicted permease
MFPSQAMPPKDPSDRRRRQLAVFGRLEDPAAIRRISQAVTAAGANLDTAYPIDLRRPDDPTPQVVPRNWSVRTLADVNDELEGQFLTFEAALTAIVGLVLVVACTNLANLILARGSSRMHELAVRRALGASRTRLVFDQMAESWLLAAMGSIGAFVVIRLLLFWFTGATLPIAEAAFVQLDPRLDWTTLALAGAAMLASLLVFGVAPAIQLTRVQVRPALASEGGSTGHLRWRTRRTLIAVQVMISLSFFLMAAFAVRVARWDRERPSGVDVDRLAIGLLNFQLPPWDESSAGQAIDRLMTASETQPGVDTVAVVSGMPFGTNYTPGADVTPIDKPFLPGHENYSFAELISATPGVFTTLGVPIVRGRGFDARDRAGGNPVAVLSAMTARQLFGTTDVLGREFLMRNNRRSSGDAAVHTLTVIGVAGDTDTQFRRSRQSGVVWVPLAQHYEPLLALVGRTSGDPAELVPALKALGTRADPNLVVDRPGTAAVTITGVYVLMDDVSRLAGGLAALALVLGMAGLFGVLSHMVSRRTREMGVRLALGADPRAIRWLVVRDGLQPVLSGLSMGFLIALAVRFLLRSVYGSPFSTADALIFALSPLPILAAALVACYWPAKRASNVHPNVALREL